MKKPRRSEVIRQYVARILGGQGITEAPVPVEQLAEALGVQVRYGPFEGELAGMLLQREGQAIIGVNSSHHVHRQRFTIAHELGHFILHGGEVHIDRSFKVSRRDNVSSMAVEPNEIEANRFAAELLMPYSIITRDLESLHIDIEDEQEVKLLASKYQVSVQAMTHRLTNLLGL